MIKDERIKLYAALSAPFPEEAIERTDGHVTGRGYDTTGIKYQYLADRLNEVLGVGGFRTERTITVKGVTSAKGRQGYEAIAEVRLELGAWMDGMFIVIAQAWGDGGHIAVTEADARKGSFTNAFKKACAFLGPGREAYRGTLDDDHEPVDEVTPRMQAAAVPVRQASRALDVEPPTVVSMAPISPAHPVRNRLTSKQFAALRSLARTTGYDDKAFKEEVRKRFGTEVAYLSTRQASDLIGELLARTHGHGAREAS